MYSFVLWGISSRFGLFCHHTTGNAVPAIFKKWNGESENRRIGESENRGMGKVNGERGTGNGESLKRGIFKKRESFKTGNL